MVQVRKRRQHALSRWVQRVNFTGQLRPLSGVHVLVVEDDAANREVVAELLRLYGAQPQLCGSAEEAIDVLVDSRPDVLVCDLRLPNMDGHSLIGHVRSLPPEHGGAVPAVAVTGCQEEQRDAAIASGFQDFFVKPIKWDALVPALHQLARKRPPHLGSLSAT